MTTSRAGFVYVLTNSELPDHCKIGGTSRTVTARRKEIRRAYGTEQDWIEASRHMVPDWRAVEAEAHRILARRRVPRSEVFDVSVKIAQNAIYTAVRRCRARPWYARQWYRLTSPRPERAPRRWRRARHSHQEGTLIVFLAVFLTTYIAVFRPEPPGWIPPPAARSVLWIEALAEKLP